MRKLANLIENELKTQEICAVYDSELARVFPKTVSSAKRKERIKRFAQRQGLAVTFYDVGLCAIFEKPSKGISQRRLMLPLEPRRAESQRRRR